MSTGIEEKKDVAPVTETVTEPVTKSVPSPQEIEADKLISDFHKAPDTLKGDVSATLPADEPVAVPDGETETTPDWMTPRLQKALDSTKGSDATKAALALDPDALERIAKLRESVAKANGRLGAYTRIGNKEAVAETPPEVKPTPKEDMEEADDENEDDINEDNFYEEGPKAFQAIKKENAELKQQFSSLKERLDAQDKRDQERVQRHRTETFDELVSNLDPKVYPQYGEGALADLEADDPAFDVRSELWTEVLDVLEDADKKGKSLSVDDAFELAFFHIHREAPPTRPEKLTAKKPTGTVRPKGNPPVRTPKQAEMEDIDRLLAAFHNGKP